MTRKLLFVGIVLIGVVFAITTLVLPKKATKLYWFIPDGMRADENLITVYKWAQEGKLPNIKKMMDQGSYSYSIPDFPSHTPVNFASLMTGTHPSVNGVGDGPMRIEGQPLTKASVGGFTSGAKKVPSIWTMLENAGKKVALLSIPGSTPPELKNGIDIRGRWGNWGSDDAALIFESIEKQSEMKQVGTGFRLFYFGDTLTKFIPSTATTATIAPSYSPIKKAIMTAHGLNIYTFIIDSTDDNKTNYDTVAYSLTETGPALAQTKQGTWTEWQPVTLQYQTQPYLSQIKFNAIKVWADGQFRIRVLYNNLNPLVTKPEAIATEMTKAIGPMVDFADSFPPQLIYEPEDKQIFLDEAFLSLDYHKKAADFVLSTYKPDVLIQDIYTPNQMLSSRWWMRYIDPKSKDYTSEKSKEAMDEVLRMYQGLDAIVGEALKHDDGHTLFVLSSDHGMILQERTMALNNLFASKGWLSFTTNPITGETIINWDKTKVIYLQTNNIYINPQGLAGSYKRAAGETYQQLRNDVQQALADLLDKGNKPIVRTVAWDKIPQELDMPVDRIGDLVIEIAPGYGFTEAATQDGSVFTDSLISGNKQGYDPATDGLQTPFVIMGPGVKKNNKINASIQNVDQLPTILKLLGVSIPQQVQGKILNEIIK
jgi:predicted AlkP superfamily phosphohydrolase/phosphomutase